MVGGALYLVAVGLLGLGLGAIFRRTAGAVSAFVGLLVIVPLVASFFPGLVERHRREVLPRPCGHGRLQRNARPHVPVPWIGFAVLAYAALALLAGGLLLARRDA